MDLKSHEQLTEEISSLLINISNKDNNKDYNKDYNKDNNKDNNTIKINILTYLKNLVKISKMNNNEIRYEKMKQSDIINNLSRHNYNYIIDKFKSVNGNIELNEWLESINNLNILIISLDNIINWLVFKR